MLNAAARIDRARRLMREQGVDALLLSVGADLPYLTGYEAMPTERLTMFVLTPDAEPVLVVPRLEAPRVSVPGRSFVVRPWDETEDPVEIVAGVVGRATTALVADTTWSVFLLRLQDALPAARFGSASGLMRELRMRKDAAELAHLRAAGAAADRVVTRLGAMAFSGVAEREMSHRIRAMLVDEGHETASFAIVASGPNGASPHHEPGDRVMADGDAVVVDIGGRLSGYCSDTTRTFHVGEPGADAARAMEVLLRAQEEGVAAVRPGVTAEEVDRVTRQVIADGGYGEYFVHRTGHGIGLEGHEHPYIVEGNDLHLEPSMTFSVEPGIYVPGAFGLRIEDIVAVTADGCERLNTTARGFHLVM